MKMTNFFSRLVHRVKGALRTSPTTQRRTTSYRRERTIEEHSFERTQNNIDHREPSQDILKKHSEALWRLRTLPIQLNDCGPDGGDRRISIYRPQNGNNHYTLYVKVPFYVNGITQTISLLSFQPDDTVRSIKVVFRNTYRDLVGNQRIVFWGKELQDDRTLRDYSIQSGSTVGLVLCMEIFVKMLCGGKIFLEIRPSDTVHEIKSKIHQKQKGSRPPELSRLIFAGKGLKNDGIAEDYGIRSKSTLHLVHLLRGGGDKDDEGLRILIQLPSGRKIRIPTGHSRSSTVYDIKLDVQNKIRVPAEEQVLLYRAHELDSRITMWDYGVYEGEFTFHLEFRLPSLPREPPFSIDTIRLWIPTSLEEEIKHREDNQYRYGEYGDSKPRLHGPDMRGQLGMDPSQPVKQSSAALPITESDINVISPRDQTPKIRNESIPTVLEEPQHPSVDEAPSSSPPAIRCSTQDCNKTFPSQDEFSRHKRYHNRPEQCPQCPRIFGTKTHLNRHINDVHLTTNTFYCSVARCQYSRGSSEGKFFPRKANLARHVRARHRDDIIDGGSNRLESFGNQQPGTTLGGETKCKGVQAGGRHSM